MVCPFLPAHNKWLHQREPSRAIHEQLTHLLRDKGGKMGAEVQVAAIRAPDGHMISIFEATK